MQNLEVKDAILTTKKTKSEIKKELEDSIANGKKSEKTDIEEMANNCTESEGDAAKFIHEFEEIIKNKKIDIVRPVYYQGKIFQKFKSKERFVIFLSLLAFLAQFCFILFEVLICSLCKQVFKFSTPLKLILSNCLWLDLDNVCKNFK